MSEFGQSLRAFVYAVICMECLLQLTSKNSYYKYMKLFAYILIVSLSCRMLFSIVNEIDDVSQNANQMYEEWMKQWEEMEVLIHG